jgi:MoxR-like ATPase
MRTAILHAAMFCPTADGGWGLPLLVMGEPGGAKTAKIKQFARRCSWPCQILSPGLMGEGGFGVVPVPEVIDGRTYLSHPLPAWTRPFFAAKRGIVFYDEVTTAPPQLQAPIMGGVADKMIGSEQLPLTVRVMGACNPPEQAAGGYDLAAPLANRFCHLKWELPTIEEHAAYMLRAANEEDEQPINVAAEEARVLAAWPAAFARALGEELGFLKSNTGAKNRCPRVGDPKASRAWPSDRTWEMAVRARAASIVHGLNDLDTDDFIGGCIGAVTATEWATWRDQADLPDTADLLDGKIEFKHDVLRADRSFAVIGSAAALVSSMQKGDLRKARGEKVWGLLEALPDIMLDIAVEPGMALVNADLHMSDAAQKSVPKIYKVMRAAGVKV